MPHAEDYKYIQVKELHPTIGAEVFGVDFSKSVPDEVFEEILAAITKAHTFTPGSLYPRELMDVTSAVRSARIPPGRSRRRETRSILC